jgi:hypothetical protein
VDAPRKKTSACLLPAQCQKGSTVYINRINKIGQSKAKGSFGAGLQTSAASGMLTCHAISNLL